VGAAVTSYSGLQVAGIVPAVPVPPPVAPPTAAGLLGTGPPAARPTTFSVRSIKASTPSPTGGSGPDAAADRSDDRGGGRDVALAALFRDGLGDERADDAVLGWRIRAAAARSSLGRLPSNAFAACADDETDANATLPTIAFNRLSANPSADLLINAFVLDIVAADNAALGVPPLRGVGCCATH